jgi:hypothetical protein
MADGLVKVAEGVDYSAGWSTALVNKIEKAGYTFAVRYIGTPGRGKSLRSEEVEYLRARGIEVVSVYEDREGTALEGFSRGAKDARKALEDAISLGMPAGRPIYFAVDTDTTVARVREYFLGVCSVLPHQQVGVYGGYWIVKGLADEGLATWLWQTRAWSKVKGKVRWDERIHLAQFPKSSNDVVLGVCDLDWALKADYGQWGESPGEENELNDEDRKLLKETNELLKLSRVTQVTVSNDTEALIAQLRGDPELADKLLADAKLAGKTERARLFPK